MKLKIENFLLSPTYFLLFSIYPVLVLYSSNIYQVSLSVLFRPLFISVIIALLLLGLMNLFFHEWHKSALISTLIILFYSTYGHIENFLTSKEIKGSPTYIFAGWLVFVVLFIFLKKIFNFKLYISSLAPSLNLMAIILLLFPLIRGIRYGIVSSMNFSSEVKNIKQLDFSSMKTIPDIYYIIPDGYASSDILQEAFNYDNNEFIAKLEALGFYVADCSQSNYPNTSLSLTSSLNMDYIQNLNEKFRPEEIELFFLFSTLQNNSIKQIFDETGYSTIAFASGFTWAEMKNFDIYLSPPPGQVSEFEVLFLKTTIFQLLDNIGIINLDNIIAERYRERTRLVFNSFSDIASMPGPKFVFIHILATHPPFVFDEHGNSVTPYEINDRDGYLNQVKFVSEKIIESVEILIAQSKTPPIIIIQGDHGLLSSHLDWRFGILNAYYLPGHNDLLYPTITPVNTFRLIFNNYFGTDYQLLPDISYFSDIPYLYDFSTVDNDCITKNNP